MHVCDPLRCTPRVLFPFSDVDDGAERTLRELADGPKLGGEAHAPEGRAAEQRGLDRLEKGAERTRMRFEQGKSKALHLGRNRPLQQDMLGHSQPESSCAEPWGPGGPQVDHFGASKVPLGQRRLTASWAAVGKALAAGGGR